MSYRIPLNRRRSRSTSEAPPSPVSRNPHNDAWNLPSKRAYPSSPGYTGLPSPNKWEDTDSIWRRGKRYRRNTSVSVPSRHLLVRPTHATHRLQSQHDAFDTQALKSSIQAIAPKADHTFIPPFPATSAEFNLYPRPPHKDLVVQSNLNDALPSTDVFGSGITPDLSQLRSDAFGELRRSVEESGEGLVRRMRDYETTRSRGGVYSKAKDSIRRGRKRHSLSSRPRRVVDAEDGSDDDDEVEIVAVSGELSSEFSGRRDVRKKRAISLGMAESNSHSPPFMDLDRSPQPASPDAASDQSGYASDDDAMDLNPDGSCPTDTTMSSPAPALSHSFYTSTNSSVVSIPSHFSGDQSVTSPPYPFCPPPTSSRSEKAIAALTLAMANGAGDLNDYEALRALEPASIIDDSQVGELWH